MFHLTERENKNITNTQLYLSCFERFFYLFLFVCVFETESEGPGTHSVDQTALELRDLLGLFLRYICPKWPCEIMILLHQQPEFLDCRYATTCLDHTTLDFTLFVH